jgi:hypothetical protein
MTTMTTYQTIADLESMDIHGEPIRFTGHDPKRVKITIDGVYVGVATVTPRLDGGPGYEPAGTAVDQWLCDDLQAYLDQHPEPVAAAIVRLIMEVAC